MANLEIMRLWSAALRSDEFEQGRGNLARTSHDGSTQHCCLGVLCELAIRAGVPLNVTKDAYGVTYYDGSAGTPPVSVRKWAGLGSSILLSLPRLGMRPAFELNDTYKMPFAEIADAIDATFPGE